MTLIVPFVGLRRDWRYGVTSDGWGGGAATIRGDNAGSGTALREAYANCQRQRNRGEEITSTSATVVLATNRPPDHPTTLSSHRTVHREQSTTRESVLSELFGNERWYILVPILRPCPLRCIQFSKKMFLTKFINYEKIYKPGSLCKMIL